MAFGDPRTGSPLTNQNASPGAGISATGSIAISAGDLIVVNYSRRNSGAVTITDNIGHTYNSLTRATLTATVNAYWAIVQNSGTLTSVSGSHASSNDDVAIMVAVFEGPFQSSPLDVNPAAATDSSSPYTCPATGTLAQAAELVIGYMAQGNGGVAASYGANNSFTVHGAASSGTTANTCSGALCYLLVSSTATVTPEFTSSASTSGAVGTASFKKQLSLVYDPRAVFAHMLVR